MPPRRSRGRNPQIIQFCAQRERRCYAHTTVPVDRSGAGPVVELYPAASLRSWGLYRPGYKQAAKPDVLGCLVDDLRARAQWLDCGPHEQSSGARMMPSMPSSPR